MIPQCDPKAGYLDCEEEIKHAISNVLASGQYVLGNEVSQFEKTFGEYLGCPTVVGVASGTDALQLALMSLELQPLDQVATVSFTATATVNAIVRSGLTPVFVDVREGNGLMDLDQLEGLLSKDANRRIKAVVVVHLYGNVVDMGLLLTICERYNVKLVEDCAQAHGAAYKGKKVGGFGDAAAFSFYPTKNLGGLGDGGAVVSNHASLSSKFKSWREYGWTKKHNSEEVGMNSRLDEIQAAILNVKLKHLDIANAKRESIAQFYSAKIENEHMMRLSKGEHIAHVYHQFVLRSSNRNALIRHLESHEIGFQVHYPVPVHQQRAYASYASFGEMKVSERLSSEVVSLPMFPTLAVEDQEKVVEVINAFDT
ncbi:MAG: DegT/DnrJ/EryC1/StrS family aminotransferase [Reichenbachiella sp.]